MSHSGLAQIESILSSVRWACTDSTLFEWVLAEVAKLVPGCKIEKYVLKQAFVEPFFAKFDKLGAGEYSVAWWIMKQLCEKGWEPFGGVGDLNSSYGRFNLRPIARAD